MISMFFRRVLMPPNHIKNLEKLQIWSHPKGLFYYNQTQSHTKAFMANIENHCILLLTLNCCKVCVIFQDKLVPTGFFFFFNETTSCLSNWVPKKHTIKKEISNPYQKNRQNLVWQADARHTSLYSIVTPH